MYQNIAKLLTHSCIYIKITVENIYRFKKRKKKKQWSALRMFTEKKNYKESEFVSVTLRNILFWASIIFSLSFCNLATFASCFLLSAKSWKIRNNQRWTIYVRVQVMQGWRREQIKSIVRQFENFIFHVIHCQSFGFTFLSISTINIFSGQFILEVRQINKSQHIVLFITKLPDNILIMYMID